MLSYQHGYHAGNAADVHKHVVLGVLLERLRAKAKPFCVLDVHAGRAVYDLTGDQARKTGEFEHGIARLMAMDAQAARALPAPLSALREMVRTMNPQGGFKRYPGSPELARAALRADDRLVVNELHPAECAALVRWSKADARVSVHQRDALEAATALVPPKIRRGLLLIDPPYEVKDDYRAVPAAAVAAARKWPEGIVMVWYPVLPDGRQAPLIEDFERTAPAGALISQLDFGRAAGSTGVIGSGVAIIHPPWQADADIATAGEALARLLRRERPGRHRLRQIGNKAAAAS
ncbi:MAG: 23S rRNA (adenine(2030)-N(6))-methyltransferase RlmJ [Rhodospirillaceae bacterium]|nr:23S rRNA (adenine(2030)-N(6))-methyltransferase RlmJ [Rhodospirillaceae bacterium]